MVSCFPVMTVCLVKFLLICYYHEMLMKVSDPSMDSQFLMMIDRNNKDIYVQVLIFHSILKLKKSDFCIISVLYFKICMIMNDSIFSVCLVQHVSLHVLIYIFNFFVMLNKTIWFSSSNTAATALCRITHQVIYLAVFDLLLFHFWQLQFSNESYLFNSNQ